MFAKLAKSITTNAANYKSKVACCLALARVKAAWSREGSYGNVRDLLREAIAACQDRWVELDSLEREAAFLSL